MHPLRLASRCLTAASLAAAALLGCGASDESTHEVSSNQTGSSRLERPPQFVLLAFDGSSSLDFWKESQAFASQAKVKFTYFISGTYFLTGSSKGKYTHPVSGRAGLSDIGFGGTKDELAARLAELDKAARGGHEIASHANGHFDGSRWSDAQWSNEFDQFTRLIFRASENNGTELPRLSFDSASVVGFRAPLLGHSPGLYTTLARKNFAYDTSKSAPPNYWPEKLSGVWNFPLANLKIVGSGKGTLSMDYNFFVAQSRGKTDPNPQNQARFEKEMVDTYMRYFESNYFGNRAPVHIGHHFSKWNGGAYWRAMQRFTKSVCGLEEVRCVTYKDLLLFMNEHADKRSGYMAGNFIKLERPPGAEDDANIAGDPVSSDDAVHNESPENTEAEHVHEGE